MAAPAEQHVGWTILFTKVLTPTDVANMHRVKSKLSSSFHLELLRQAPTQQLERDLRDVTALVDMPNGDPVDVSVALANSSNADTSPIEGGWACIVLQWERYRERAEVALQPALEMVVFFRWDEEHVLHLKIEHKARPTVNLGQPPTAPWTLLGTHRMTGTDIRRKTFTVTESNADSVENFFIQDSDSKAEAAFRSNQTFTALGYTSLRKEGQPCSLFVPGKTEWPRHEWSSAMNFRQLLDSRRSLFDSGARLQVFYRWVGGVLEVFLNRVGEPAPREEDDDG